MKRRFDITRRSAIRTGLIASGAILGGSSTAAASWHNDGAVAVLHDQEITEDPEDASVEVFRGLLPEGGWVSIHDAARRLYHPQGVDSQAAINESFIGLTEWVEPGDHWNLEVPLYPDHVELPGDPRYSDQEPIARSQPVFAIPHTPGDTDTESFELGVHGAYSQGWHELPALPPVHSLGNITFEGATTDERQLARIVEERARREFGPGAPDDQEVGENQNDFARIEFSDQATLGKTLVIDHLALEHDGFVTIHTMDLIEEEDSLNTIVGVGDVLSPGEYTDVPVSLFRDGSGFSSAFADQDQLEEDRTLVAVPHRDINHSGEFEFEADPHIDVPFTNGTHERDDLPFPGAVNSIADVEVLSGD